MNNTLHLHPVETVHIYLHAFFLCGWKETILYSQVPRLSLRGKRGKMSLPSMASSGGFAGDRTLFVGAKVPQEIKVMVKLLKNTEKSTFRELLKGI